MLTTDVLVHTWDLARSIGVDVELEAELEAALSGARQNNAGLRSLGMFSAPVDVPAEATVQSRLLAFLGRDPKWRGNRGSQSRVDVANGSFTKWCIPFGTRI
jgi:hypothetical protein